MSVGYCVIKRYGSPGASRYEPECLALAGMFGAAEVLLAIKGGRRGHGLCLVTRGDPLACESHTADRLDRLALWIDRGVARAHDIEALRLLQQFAAQHVVIYAVIKGSDGIGFAARDAFERAGASDELRRAAANYRAGR